MDPDARRLNPDFDRLQQPSPWLDHHTYEDLFAHASRELGTAQRSVKATSCALCLTAAVLVLKEQIALAHARFVADRPIVVQPRYGRSLIELTESAQTTTAHYSHSRQIFLLEIDSFVDLLIEISVPGLVDDIRVGRSPMNVTTAYERKLEGA
jgi:hypothetical protein